MLCLAIGGLLFSDWKLLGMYLWEMEGVWGVWRGGEKTVVRMNCKRKESIYNNNKNNNHNNDYSILTSMEKRSGDQNLSID